MNFLIQESTFFWLGLMVVLLAIEACTVNLTTIWFALGALGATIAQQMGANFMVQAAVFVLIGLVSLLCTRPLIQQGKQIPYTPTNADRNIGRIAHVIEDISPVQNGRISLDGVEWAARTEGSYSLSAGSLCRVTGLESTVLVVEPYLETSDTF